MADDTARKPLAIYDIYDSPWWEEFAGSQRHAELLRWAEQEGVSLDHAWRIEFYLVDSPFVELGEFERDEAGHRMLRCSQGHTGHAGGAEGPNCGLLGHWRLPPRRVAVASLPPHITSQPGEASEDDHG